jgi:hypothetical protein
MSVYRLRIARRSRKGGPEVANGFLWVARGNLDRVALPSVMRKIIAHGLNVPDRRS